MNNFRKKPVFQYLKALKDSRIAIIILYTTSRIDFIHSNMYSNLKLNSILHFNSLKITITNEVSNKSFMF